MTHRANENFNFAGIYLPYGPPDHVPVLTTGPQTEGLARDGFILVSIPRPGMAVVQSIADGQLYVNELIVIGHHTQFNKPPLFRVSGFNPGLFPPGQPLRPGRTYPHYVLPDRPWFPKVALAEVMFNQAINNNIWSVYYRHPNGGTLQNLIELHNRYQRPVPETFIWHVMEQLSMALHYMYRGRDAYNTDPRPGTGPFPGPNPGANAGAIPHRRVLHRNLTPSSIYINYEQRGPGSTPASGQIKNAFPTIQIGDWRNSAIEGDPMPPVPTGRFGQNLTEWEDVLGLGQIIRSLMLAHVPLWNPNTNPCPDPNQGLNEYGNNWRHRPDSRNIMSLRGVPPDPYTDLLYSFAIAFEVNNFQQLGLAAIVGDPDAPNRNAPNPMRGTLYQFPGSRMINPGVRPTFATDMAFVVNHVRVVAAGVMRGQRRPKPPGYYTARDVSWTKPTSMPSSLFGGAPMNGPALQGTNPIPLLNQADAANLRSLNGGAAQLRPDPQVRIFNMGNPRAPPA